MSVTCDRFSPGTPVSSINKTDRYDITEILLKVALNTIKPNQTESNFLNDYDDDNVFRVHSLHCIQYVNVTNSSINYILLGSLML